MTDKEKAFLLEYEKLCRKHGLYVDGREILPVGHNEYLRWGITRAEHPWTYQEYVSDIFFDDLDFELMQEALYDDDFYYIQDGKIKQYVDGDA